MRRYIDKGRRCPGRISGTCTDWQMVRVYRSDLGAKGTNRARQENVGLWMFCEH